jgi:hypothetical protein
MDEGALPPFIIELGDVAYDIPEPNYIVCLIYDRYETCINLDLEVLAGV